MMRKRRYGKDVILQQLTDEAAQRRFNVASDELDEDRYQECRQEAMAFMDERSREEQYARM